MQYVAIDYGQTRCGIAIAQAGIALPHKTLPTSELLPYLIEYANGREMTIVFDVPSLRWSGI